MHVLVCTVLYVVEFESTKGTAYFSLIAIRGGIGIAAFGSALAVQCELGLAVKRKRRV